MRARVNDRLICISLKQCFVPLQQLLVVNIYKHLLTFYMFFKHSSTKRPISGYVQETSMVVRVHSISLDPLMLHGSLHPICMAFGGIMENCHLIIIYIPKILKRSVKNVKQKQSYINMKVKIKTAYRQPELSEKSLFTAGVGRCKFENRVH